LNETRRPNPSRGAATAALDHLGGTHDDGSPTAFLLLTTQRTGSTWLQTLLDSHPRIAVHGEMFLLHASRHPPFGADGVERFEYYTERAGDGHRSARPYRTFAYLDTLFAAHSEASAVGFKMMYDQVFRHPEVLAYLVRRDVKVVHLVRRNLLDIVISREAMKARGLAHATSKEEVKDLQVTLDPLTLRGRLRLIDVQVAAYRRALEALRIDHVEVVYEDLMEGRTSIAPILRWLGVPHGDDADLSSQMIKLNPDRQSQLVANYDKVARLLEHTRYASLVRG